jgi:hypothetical protein
MPSRGKVARLRSSYLNQSKKPLNWQKRKKDMSKQEKAKPLDAPETTAELPSGVISTNLLKEFKRKELMKMVAQSNESNLDIAKHIDDLLNDIVLGINDGIMSANDVSEYIEEYIDGELELLIFKLENGIK